MPDALASALAQFPTGMLFDRYGPRCPLTVLGLLAACGTVLFALSDSAAGLAAGRVLVPALIAYARVRDAPP